MSPLRNSSIWRRAGSAAWADNDAGLAVAVMRNRFSGDLTAVERIDESIAETWS